MPPDHHLGDSIWHPQDTNGEAETYELREDGNIANNESCTPKYTKRYVDGNTIDWFYEDSKEKERAEGQRSLRGARGILIPFFESMKMWLVVVGTGIGIGLIGAWLDVLVKWLSDLRVGRCTAGFLYNSVSCCSGFGPGECTEWQSWSNYLEVKHIFTESFLQISVYVSLAIALAGSSAVLVKTYAPYAFHTGIPEIKAILRGYVLDAFLTPWTLLIKAIGLALSVSSGLSLGKEGPLVHVACCLTTLLTSFFKQFERSEGQKRKLLAASAAAGVSVAFGSPLGGVIFILEELDSFANNSDVMWRGFVASAIAAVALQYVDPFGTSKLVLFQVTNGSDTWRAFELFPWLALGVIGGVLGSLLIKLNVEIALYRRNSILNDWPVLEVVGTSAITAAISYLVVFTRVQSSELVANLFQECNPSKIDYHGLCNPTANAENIFLLVVTALLKVAFTAWTFGMMVPAGIFLPTITIGACLGRAIGILTQATQTAFTGTWIFQSCPPEPTVRCVSPGFYAVIGASAMLAGVTRMTVSLVVIMFELTGALSHVLPIMISVMTAKWVGDALGRDGIYTVWIAMRGYPWLPPVDYHDQGESAAGIMKPVDQLVVIEDGESSLEELDDTLKTHEYQGFPVVRHGKLVGYITRDTLRCYIDRHLSSDSRHKKCSFSSGNNGDEHIDFSNGLEKSILHLRKETPQELIVRIFQRTNFREMLFTHRGDLVGLVTKKDVVALLTMHFPHTGSLS
ncbi:Cl-channel protein [Marasmius fiardii PR-910]|nr:Cl-channel protein [Marasmius fiardii PR-910]